MLRRCESFGKRISKAWTRCSAPSSVSGSQSLSPRHEPQPSLHVPSHSKYHQQQRLPPLHRLVACNAVVVHEASTHEGCSVGARDPCDLSVLMSGDVSATSPVFVHPGRRFLGHNMSSQIHFLDLLLLLDSYPNDGHDQECNLVPSGSQTVQNATFANAQG